MTEPIDVDQRPARAPRQWLPWAVAGVAVALAAGVAIGAVLTRPDAQPQAAGTTAAPNSPAAATSPSDTLGRSACKAILTPEILAPDTLKTWHRPHDGVPHAAGRATPDLVIGAAV